MTRRPTVPAPARHEKSAAQVSPHRLALTYSSVARPTDDGVAGRSDQMSEATAHAHEARDQRDTARDGQLPVQALEMRVRGMRRDAEVHGDGRLFVIVEDRVKNPDFGLDSRSTSAICRHASSDRTERAEGADAASMASHHGGAALARLRRIAGSTDR